MNILFISYVAVSLCEGSVRSGAMIRALADAGHRIDLITPHCNMPHHPNIRVLAGGQERKLSRFKLRMEAFRAVFVASYDVIHAVDYAAFIACRLCCLRKIHLVYDAERRFTGPPSSEDSLLLKFFSTHFKRLEAALLAKAVTIFSSCSSLTEDLLGMNKKALILQLEDIPIQPLYGCPEVEEETLLQQFSKRPTSVVVCSILPSSSVGFRNLLMASRKVIDTAPDTAFFFKGAHCEQARQMAVSLDISKNCTFLSPEEPETFLSALDIADAVLFVPHGNNRYIHPQVYTLLHAPGPLVTVHDTTYDEVLTDKNSIQVLSSSDAIANGILRAIQEPLFSLAIATEGHKLVADRYTYSSFKHKVRMAYHDLSKKA